MSTNNNTILPHGAATVVSLFTAALRELHGLNYASRSDAACRAIVDGGSCDEGIALMDEVDQLIDAVSVVLDEVKSPGDRFASDGLNSIVFSIVGVDELDEVLEEFSPARRANRERLIRELLDTAPADERAKVEQMLAEDAANSGVARAELRERYGLAAELREIGATVHALHADLQATAEALEARVAGVRS